MPKFINDLFWEYYRPKTLNQMVLLPRVKSLIGNGFNMNFLLHGNSGTGKSTVTRILLKDKSFKRINASLYGKVDILRDELDEFCTTMRSPLIKSEDKRKYVYLEEFENSTPEFKEGFKAFVEDFDKHVRFIITMNDLSCVNNDALLSRFTILKFDPIDDEERKFLHDGYFKYLSAVVKHAEMQVSEDTINKLITTYFPDLRRAVQGIQEIYISGQENIIIQESFTDIYNFIMNGKTTLDNIYEFVVDNYTNRPKELMVILGRPFYKYLIDNHLDIIQGKGFKLIGVSKQYNAEYDFTVDPVLHLVSYISDLKKIIGE